MTNSAEMTCNICNNPKKNQVFQVREMMYGTREKFTYFECSQCGCLQILNVPRELASYYPSDYYSFEGTSPYDSMRQYLKTRGDRYAFFGTGLIGKLVCARYPNDMLKRIALTRTASDSRILDVGCGFGGLVFSLRNLGFKKVLGIDPFVGREFIRDDIRIMRKTIHDLPDGESFDLILFNHSLEHIPDQLETLSKVSRILADDGVCVVRIPVKTETVWKMYGVDWVQIDAPRHLFIHTVASFRHLTERAGLQIESVLFDSTEFLFCGSDLYKKDIPLTAKALRGLNPLNYFYSQRQIRQFRKMAGELNRTNQGDQATFSLARNGG